MLIACLFCDSGFGWTCGVCPCVVHRALRRVSLCLAFPPRTPTLPSAPAGRHSPPLPLSSWADHGIHFYFVFTDQYFVFTVLWLSKCCSQLMHKINVMTFSSLTTFCISGSQESCCFCSIFYVLTTHPSPDCCPVVRIFLPVQCFSPEKGVGRIHSVRPQWSGGFCYVLTRN